MQTFLLQCCTAGCCEKNIYAIANFLLLLLFSNSAGSCIGSLSKNKSLNLNKCRNVIGKMYIKYQNKSYRYLIISDLSCGPSIKQNVLCHFPLLFVRVDNDNIRVIHGEAFVFFVL